MLGASCGWVFLSTGDELAQAGQSARIDQIYDANRPMLCAVARKWGHKVVDLGCGPDNCDELRTILNDAAKRCDVILTSGGASAGDEDHISVLLQDTGSLALWRVAMKPGRPLALGLWDGGPVFGASWKSGRRNGLCVGFCAPCPFGSGRRRMVRSCRLPSACRVLKNQKGWSPRIYTRAC